jgi:outer membrane protein assembly factor BamB
VRGGRIVALRAATARSCGKRDHASRSESSPLIDGDRLYFGSENGTLYSMRASDGAVRWKRRVGGAVKSGLALANGKLYFGDYKGRMHAIRQRDGGKVWSTGTSGARFGLSSGRFYSTPAVAYGRVYVGNTDGKVYSFDSGSGKLAWSKSTGGFVYSSPAVAQVPGGRPTVYIGSYSGRFLRARRADGTRALEHDAKGKISGGATVVGDIVYFSNLKAKSRSASAPGRDARCSSSAAGRSTGCVRRPADLPDRYSSLYALEPRRR